MDKHSMIGIRDYLNSTYSQEIRYCTKHRDQPLCLGCNKCWTVCCAKCVSTLGPCGNGTSDLFATVDQYVFMTCRSLESSQWGPQRSNNVFIYKASQTLVSSGSVNSDTAVCFSHRLMQISVKLILWYQFNLNSMSPDFCHCLKW